MRPLAALTLALAAATLPLALAGASSAIGQARAMQAPVASCDTDAECAALPMCALKPGCDGGPWSEPFRLVGLGCEGAAGRLYADHEDQFPRCKRIQPTGAN